MHSLANIEQWAIDLSWDIICRFGPSHEYPDKSSLPNEFYSDFIKVACDEAKHFDLLEKRLIELGSHFGALPVHNGFRILFFSSPSLLKNLIFNQDIIKKKVYGKVQLKQKIILCHD